MLINKPNRLCNTLLDGMTRDTLVAKPHRSQQGGSPFGRCFQAEGERKLASTIMPPCTMGSCSRWREFANLRNFHLRRQADITPQSSALWPVP